MRGRHNEFDTKNVIATQLCRQGTLNYRSLEINTDEQGGPFLDYKSTVRRFVLVNALILEPFSKYISFHSSCFRLLYIAGNKHKFEPGYKGSLKNDGLIVLSPVLTMFN